MSTDLFEQKEEVSLAVIEDDPSALSPHDYGVPSKLTPASLAADPYVGVAAMPFDEKAQTVLAKYTRVADDWIDIKPNGQPYLAHIKVRMIFNEAFGFGGWAIVPVGDYKPEDDVKKVTLYRAWRLYVNGRYVDETTSAGEYWKSNAEQNYGDAAEACKSFAINRFSKAFNIAAQLWDKTYVEWWRSTYAMQDGGKWKKKTQAMGADDRSDEHPTITAQSEAPVPRTDKPITSQATQLSAPRNNTVDLIFVTAGKEWPHGGMKHGFFDDANGKTWKVQGDKNVALCRAACGRGITVRCEYVIEKGKFKSIVACEAIE